jgi:hypothetical protein
MVAHTAPPPSCLSGLPPSPGRLSAPVALDAGCARVVVLPGGGVRLRPRPRVSDSAGAYGAPGETVAFQGVHVVRKVAGRVIWRSARTFHPGNSARVFTTVSAAASSGRRLAYVVSRWWGRPRAEHRLLFIADGNGRERLVATGPVPLGWTPRGLVASDSTRHGVVLYLWRRDGREAAAPRRLAVTSSTWDWSSSRLYAISGGRLIRSDGSAVSTVVSLASLGFSRPSRVGVAALGHGLLELVGASRLAILNAGGRVLAAAELPAGWRLDGAVAAQADGTVAFEATPTASLTGRFRLYASLRGQRARLLGSYEVPPSCASHSLSVRGSAVLVTAPATFARVYDARSSGPPVDLARAVQWLRDRHRSGRVELI